MTTWWITSEQTVVQDGVAQQQITVLRSLPGKSREQAVAELHKTVKRYVPESLKGVPHVAVRNDDGSFSILPKKANKGYPPCTVRLREQFGG
ncbi:hypothetical protein [Streptomyces syringium]|uniref:hypothetical protein n=1 Tax=Streptomyces syringium TaxID=76729 RepID=UPI003AAAA829